MKTPPPLAFLLFLLASLCGLTAQTSAWVDRQVATPLGQCGAPMLCYDAERRETLLWTGFNCAQTWTWNGVVWTRKFPSATPPNTGGAACWDSVRKVVVFVVGNQSTGLGTWEWNGVDWTLRGPGPTPARGNFSMVFDAAHGVSLLYGGSSGNTDDSFGDLWAWNGTSWTQIAMGGPTPRSNASMAFDASRQRVVLFGGEGQWLGNGAHLADTWEWNGSYWFNHFGISGPPARRAASMAYDSVRQRIVMFGGFTGSGALADMWEWNGSAWLEKTPVGSPGSSAAGLVYDSERGVMVTRTNLANPTTWEYADHTGPAATFATYGSGCAGPTGVPLLTNVAGSTPRIGSTLHLQVQNLPMSPFNAALGFIGFDATTWDGAPLPIDLSPLGFTGCDVWLAPAISNFVPNTNGVAFWDVFIPMNTFYLGVDVFFQALVLVPGWNPAGFVFSNAGHGVMGSP